MREFLARFAKEVQEATEKHLIIIDTEGGGPDKAVQMIVEKYAAGQVQQPADGAVLDAERYRALRDAVIAATGGNHHPIEAAVMQAMRESHAGGNGTELTSAAIDAAIDAALAAQKGGAA